MNISNINNVNAAKIYAETNKKLNLDKLDKLEKNDKNDKSEKYSAKDAAFDKGGVNISREAKSMNVLDFVKERIKTDMNKDISADKISQLKNLVKSGSYHVDTNALASAVISGGKA